MDIRKRLLVVIILVSAVTAFAGVPYVLNLNGVGTNETWWGDQYVTNKTFTDSSGWHNTNVNGGAVNASQGNLDFNGIGRGNGSGFTNTSVSVFMTSAGGTVAASRAAPKYSSLGGSFFTAAANGELPMPSAVTITNFYVSYPAFTAAIGTGTNVGCYFMTNGVQSHFGVTLLSTGSAMVGSNLTSSLYVPAGTKVCLQWTNDATTAANNVPAWSFELRR